MTNVPEDLQERITAYIDGELPPAEAARLEVFLANTDPTLAQQVIEMIANKGTLRTSPRPMAPRDLSARVMEQIERSSLLHNVEEITTTPHRRWWQSRGLVAAGVVLILGGFTYFIVSTVISPRNGHWENVTDKTIASATPREIGKASDAELHGPIATKASSVTLDKDVSAKDGTIAANAPAPSKQGAEQLAGSKVAEGTQTASKAIAEADRTSEKGPLTGQQLVAGGTAPTGGMNRANDALAQERTDDRRAPAGGRETGVVPAPVQSTPQSLAATSATPSEPANRDAIPSQQEPSRSVASAAGETGVPAARGGGGGGGGFGGRGGRGRAGGGTGGGGGRGAAAPAAIASAPNGNGINNSNAQISADTIAPVNASTALASMLKEQTDQPLVVSFIARDAGDYARLTGTLQTFAVANARDGARLNMDALSNRAGNSFYNVDNNYRNPAQNQVQTQTVSGLVINNNGQVINTLPVPVAGNTNLAGGNFSNGNLGGWNNGGNLYNNQNVDNQGAQRAAATATDTPALQQQSMNFNGGITNATGAGSPGTVRILLKNEQLDTLVSQYRLSVLARGKTEHIFPHPVDEQPAPTASPQYRNDLLRKAGFSDQANPDLAAARQTTLGANLTQNAAPGSAAGVADNRSRAEAQAKPADSNLATPPANAPPTIAVPGVQANQPAAQVQAAQANGPAAGWIDTIVTIEPPAIVPAATPTTPPATRPQ